MNVRLTIRLELSLLSLSENTIAGNFDHFIEVELTYDTPDEKIKQN